MPLVEDADHWFYQIHDGVPCSRWGDFSQHVGVVRTTTRAATNVHTVMTPGEKGTVEVYHSSTLSGFGGVEMGDRVYNYMKTVDLTPDIARRLDTADQLLDKPYTGLTTDHLGSSSDRIMIV